MLRNHFLIAFRTLMGNRMYSVINVFGLTVGIGSCLVIFLIVRFELSYNRSIPAAERIFRVYTTFSGDFEGNNRGVSTGVQGAVTGSFTGLASSFALHGWGAKVTLPGQKSTDDTERQSRIALTTPDYFKMIPVYSWIRGSASSLGKPGHVVLTVDQARKYLGEGSPDAWMGQTLHYNDSLIVSVAGLVVPHPGNTDFEFTDFISLSTIPATWLKDQIPLDDWESTNSSAQLFIMLDEDTSPTDMEKQLLSLTEEYRKHNKENDWRATYTLQPLSDLHFNTRMGIFDFSRPAAHLGTLTTLSFVAVILVVLATINFVNLETARAMKRSREVGIRKVLGSTRGQLMWHFLAQSMLLTFFAILVAIPAAEMGLLLFQDFIPQGVTLSLTDVWTLSFLAGVLLVVGFFSGLYPAFVLSSFLPALALKNQGLKMGHSGSAMFRKGLIVFQFASAQLLIIGTLVIVSQIDFMLNKDLGFEKEAVIHINPPWRAEEAKRFTLKSEIERIPGVDVVSLCQSAPATKGYSSNVLSIKREGEEIRKSVLRKFGDPNYLAVYGIRLIAGRNLTPNHRSEILVNEAFLKEYGLGVDESLGYEVRQGEKAYSIVGVMKDYHVFSLHEPYQAVYMSGWEEDLYGISVKLASAEGGRQDYQEAIAGMEAAWKKVYPEYRFKYEFVDETIRNFYQTERRMSRLAGTAMAIAIIISCLGLFGLASYTAVQRTKEVGIRKVLGATAENILLLLSGDFIKLVALAFVVASPLAWWGANKFLGNYSFHTTPGISLFLLAGGSSMLFAFLTVSYQALKTSFMNPVDSLRTE
ncbi:MAG: ABC transporter permease [Cyclobacteriaceae bacterium]|nr:ABC transporter permease [Cyclobacteriaceae bacterium]